MSLVITVGEVEPSYVHATVHKLLKLINLPTGGSDSTNDLGTTGRNIGIPVDHRQVNKATGQGGDIRSIRDAHCLCFFPFRIVLHY